jgi:hypothetical protein
MPPRRRASNGSQGGEEDDNERRIKATSGKDLQTMLSIMPKLNDVEFHVWDRALKKIAHSYQWPTSILNLSEDEEDFDLGTVKERCDNKNAYIVITTKCEGHAVDDALEEEQMGNARIAYKTVHEHFYRPTQAGKQAANRNMYGTTMNNTDVNVNQFMALLSRHAKVLLTHGETISESTLLNLILDGLLPEFDSIKLILENDDASLRKVKDKLRDYADQKGLATLTRAGNDNKRSKTFTAQVTDDAKQSSTKKTSPGAIVPGKTYKGKPWIGKRGDCQR